MTITPSSDGRPLVYHSNHQALSTAQFRRAGQLATVDSCLLTHRDTGCGRSESDCRRGRVLSLSRSSWSRCSVRCSAVAATAGWTAHRRSRPSSLRVGPTCWSEAHTVRVDGKDLSFQIDPTLPSTSPSSPPTFLVSSPQRPLKGRGTLGILLFIAGR